MNSSQRKELTSNIRSAVKQGDMDSVRKQIAVMNKAIEAKVAKKKSGKLI